MRMNLAVGLSARFTIRPATWGNLTRSPVSLRSLKQWYDSRSWFQDGDRRTKEMMFVDRLTLQLYVVLQSK